MQINSVKFNEFAAAIISGGYDRSVRAWDCRSHSMEPIQVQPSKLCIINCNYVGSSTSWVSQLAWLIISSIQSCFYSVLSGLAWMKHYRCLWLLLGVLGFEPVLVWWKFVRLSTHLVTVWHQLQWQRQTLLLGVWMEPFAPLTFAMAGIRVLHLLSHVCSNCVHKSWCDLHMIYTE
jgi:hypothetical protein